MAERLQYATTPTYFRRRSARAQGWAMLAVAAVAASAVALIFELLSGGGWERWLVYPLTAVLFSLAAIHAVLNIVRGGYWEARIEGGTLYLTSPGKPTRVIPASEIGKFVTLDVTRHDGPGKATTRTYQLRLLDGRRVPLGNGAIGWLPTFRRALLRENPRIELAYEHQDHTSIPPRPDE